MGVRINFQVYIAIILALSIAACSSNENSSDDLQLQNDSGDHCTADGSIESRYVGLWHNDNSEYGEGWHSYVLIEEDGCLSDYDYGFLSNDDCYTLLNRYAWFERRGEEYFVTDLIFGTFKVSLDIVDEELLVTDLEDTEYTVKGEVESLGFRESSVQVSDLNSMLCE